MAVKCFRFKSPNLLECYCACWSQAVKTLIYFLYYKDYDWFFFYQLLKSSTQFESTCWNVSAPCHIILVQVSLGLAHRARDFCNNSPIHTSQKVVSLCGVIPNVKRKKKTLYATNYLSVLWNLSELNFIYFLDLWVAPSWSNQNT